LQDGMRFPMTRQRLRRGQRDALHPRAGPTKFEAEYATSATQRWGALDAP
jgi:hypothetical protein